MQAETPGHVHHIDGEHQALFYHQPVLLAEVLAGLAIRPSGRYIDGTLGGGGHAAAILEASNPDGQVLGIDTDPAALAAASQRLAGYGSRVALVHGNFRSLDALAHSAGFVGIDGILLDLGVSSYQLDTPERGFSFQSDGPLDMRLDPTRGEHAADLVNGASEQELADLIYQYGEEHGARRVARLIVTERRKSRIETTAQLAMLVSRALGGRHGRIHPATRTFQALRIAVNEELTSLETVLPMAMSLLAPGGRLAIISFHSLEDRIVKHTLREAARQGQITILTKKPVEANAAEARHNPRSRSAKLRVAERTSQEPADRSVSVFAKE